MTYLLDYLMFLAQALTVLAVLLALLVGALAIARRRHAGDPPGELEVLRFNDYLDKLRYGFDQAMLPPGEFRRMARRAAKLQAKQAKAAARKKRREDKRQASASAADAGATQPAPDSDVDATEAQTDTEGQADAEAQAAPVAAAQPRRVFVLSFNGDINASRVTHLRHEINGVLAKAMDGDEVVVRLNSFGGRVHGYGLAASQLRRVRDRGLRLVAAVDQAAASGGYLMAAVANRVIAAPFAVVGSIGVVAEIPNVHRLLKKRDVDVEVITAGRHKRTLTLLGENTEEGRQKLTEELADLHLLFQEFVTECRPELDLEKVATGEAWYGRRAVELNLVDDLMTSDEYLMACCDDASVYEVRWVEPKKPIERLLGQAEAGIRRFTALLPGRGLVD